MVERALMEAIGQVSSGCRALGSVDQVLGTLRLDFCRSDADKRVLERAATVIPRWLASLLELDGPAPLSSAPTGLARMIVTKGRDAVATLATRGVVVVALVDTRELPAWLRKCEPLLARAPEAP